VDFVGVDDEATIDDAAEHQRHTLVPKTSLRRPRSSR
jgi:hypothetical protein